MYRLNPCDAETKNAPDGALLFGGSSGTRTPDQEIKSYECQYTLGYTGICFIAYLIVSIDLYSVMHHPNCS